MIQKLREIQIPDRYMLGTPMPNVASPKGDTCSFTIYGNSKRMGEIMTPTYPGTYPKNMLCSYKFIGEITKINFVSRETQLIKYGSKSGNSCVNPSRLSSEGDQKSGIVLTLQGRAKLRELS